MTEQEETLIGVVEYNEAKRLQAALAEKGISVRLAGTPQGCKTRGCRINLEVYARTSDLPAVGEHLRAEQSRAFEGLDVNPDLHNSVFDPEASSAQCPACGHEFSTTLRECPECGLVFMIEETTS